MNSVLLAALILLGLGELPSVDQEHQVLIALQPQAGATLPEAGSTEASELEVIATALDSAEARTVRRSVTPSDPGSIPLPSGRWSLQVGSEDWWSPPVDVEVGKMSSSVAVDLWPAGTLKGRVRLPRGARNAKELAVFFRPSPEAKGNLGFRDGRVLCPLDAEQRWSCTLPAGMLDLRLQVDELIPHFEWSVPVQKGETQTLGSTRMQQGSAVQGWVVTIDGSALGEDATVELEPKRAGNLRPNDQERMAQRTWKAAVNSRGFFQVVGVPPGDYVLEANRTGFAPAVTTVRVVPDQVTEVANPPLTLDFPLTLEVFIDPPVDPNGDPWRLELMRLEQNLGSYFGTKQAEGASALDGTWTAESLAPGKYSLDVVSPTDDSSWWSELVDVDAALTPVFIELDAVRVEGTVQLGDLPIPATIMFGGRWGAVKVVTTADDDGKYATILPRSGAWLVDVDLEALGVKRSFPDELIEPGPGGDSEARLDLKIPDTLIAGTVVDAAGRTVQRAIVNIRSQIEGAYPFTQQLGRDDGSFEIRGLPPGPASIQATAPGPLESDVQVISFSEDRALEDLQIVVREKRIVTGQVASELGPIVGAKVLVRPADATSLSGGSYTTDARGIFEATVPGTSNEVRISVGAPGFAFRMLRVAWDEERAIGIRLQQEAGSLVVETPASSGASEAKESAGAIFHNGSAVSLFWLRAWAAINGAENASEELSVIPLMEPGEYQACWLVRGESMNLQRAALPPSRCTGGFLSPNGELRLVMPERP